MEKAELDMRLSVRTEFDHHVSWDLVALSDMITTNVDVGFDGDAYTSEMKEFGNW
jgi:hypothetical protein